MKLQTSVFIGVVLAAALIGCKKGPKPVEQPEADEVIEVTENATVESPPDIVEIPAPPDVAEAPKDAHHSKSGLAWKVLKPGEGGKHPEKWDQVKVNYTGWTTDGKMFDSSVQRGQPIVFPLNRVIPGWTEGVGMMTKGEKRRFWIPGKLAYGELAEEQTNTPGGPPHGTLVFDVELLDFMESPKPPKAPEDVATVPKNVEKSKSGLASRVLKKGTGAKHPSPSDRVTVHYSGWTTDGEMFDSSIVRGQPVTFPLNQVIPGWTEGVQQMVEGEKRRLWIPENLAYKGVPGAPQGMLVFDVDLIEIEK